VVGLVTFVVLFAAIIAMSPGEPPFLSTVASIGLANVWLSMGAFAVCCGWVVLSTRIVGRWLGWWAIASGLGLVICRFFWTSEVWYLPYLAFWIWVIILCVQLIWRPGLVLSTADAGVERDGERS
jgi:hypothetical protein